MFKIKEIRNGVITSKEGISIICNKNMKLIMTSNVDDNKLILIGSIDCNVAPDTAFLSLFAECEDGESTSMQFIVLDEVERVKSYDELMDILINNGFEKQYLENTGTEREKKMIEYFKNKDKNGYKSLYYDNFTFTKIISKKNEYVIKLFPVNPIKHTF